MHDEEQKPSIEETRAANAQGAMNILLELATALGGAGQFDAAGRAAAGAAVIKAMYGWYQEARAELEAERAGKAVTPPEQPSIQP